MKASPAQVAAIRAAVSVYDTPANRHLYTSRQVARAELVQDWDKRYRWDLLWMSRIPMGPLYDAGLNDEHIDTVLRNVVPSLGLEKTK